MDCLFCRIVAGEIPSKQAYEDDRVIAFHDIDPKAPVHVLVIPRKHIASITRLEDSDAELIGQLFVVARNLANELRIADGGYRLVVNAGFDAGQSVDHVHLHVLGGRKLKWPPG
jgi:histidine triad (HIT) family protein